MSVSVKFDSIESKLGTAGFEIISRSKPLLKFEASSQILKFLRVLECD
jgi:hypothetical protein